MSYLFNKLFLALVAGGVVIPPPPVISYGATADAGEVDTGISIAGVRYYLDVTDGNNSNVGTSPGAGNAFQTLAKEYTYTAVGGAPAVADSAFMLKRGDTYDGFVNLNKAALTTSKYLTGAYGTGARPVIRYVNSATLNNINLGAAWGNRGFERLRNLTIDALFVTQINTGTVTGSNPTAGQVITGGTSGATGTFQYASGTYWNIALTAVPTGYLAAETITWSGGSCAVSGTPNMSPAVWFKDLGDWSVVNCDVYNAASNGILIGTNQTAGTGNNVTIQNNTIHDACRAQSAGAGIDGGGCGTSLGTQTSLIESNTVYDCGIASGGLNHNIYLGNLYDTTIRLNWSYMTQNRGSHALVIHGTCDNVLVEKNLLEGCGNGLGINPGYGFAETLNGFTVRQNISRRHGRWSGQTQGYAALIAGVTNSSFYNNLYYGNAFGFQLGPGGGADSATTNLTISHETFYNNTSGPNPTGNEGQLDVTSTVTNVVIQNCIFVNTETDHFLLRVSAAGYAQTTIRNCCFYSPNTGTDATVSWNGTDYTLSAWLAWMDANRPGHGNINANPLFVDAANDDFRLQAGSPCKLAGYNSGITTDFAGNARHATTPSIGAYE